MGQDPDAIRQQIEETRTDMGETVGALGHKADVKSRATENIADKRDRLKERITGAAPDPDQAKANAKQAVGVAQENPLGLALGALAAGFVAGMLVPSTRVEDEKVGAVADQVKERAKEAGQEAVDRGRQVAQDAAQSAAETAQQSGQEHAEGMRSSVQESAQETRQQVT